MAALHLAIATPGCLPLRSIPGPCQSSSCTSVLLGGSLHQSYGLPLLRAHTRAVRTKFPPRSAKCFLIHGNKREVKAVADYRRCFCKMSDYGSRYKCGKGKKEISSSRRWC